MIDLSEQHLMDCARDQCYADEEFSHWCARGCFGASPQPYFNWTIKENEGKFEQESCTPYQGQEKECQPKNNCIYQDAQLDDFKIYYESDEEELKHLVYEGPVWVAVYVS